MRKRLLDVPQKPARVQCNAILDSTSGVVPELMKSGRLRGPCIRVFREHGLKLKLEKCSFYEKTEYLGFMVGKDRVKPNPNKVRAIKMFAPQTVCEARELLVLLQKLHLEFFRDSHIIGNRKKCMRSSDRRRRVRMRLTIIPLLTYRNRYFYQCIGICLTLKTDTVEDKPIHIFFHKYIVS